MKILLCIGSLDKGGAERVIVTMANYLSKDNEILLVPSINVIKYNINSNVKIMPLDEKNQKHNRFNRIKKLYKIIKTEQPDIIVSFLPEPSFRVLMLKKIIKIPVIVSVRNDPKEEYKSFKRRLLMRLLYPLADGYVFQTKEAQEYFNQTIQSKSVIIPNPIKDEFLHRKKLSLSKKEDVIVGVGRLEQQKNFKLLIDAFYRLSKENSEYKLMIYGEGSLKSELETQIKEYKLKKRIILAGNQDDIAVCLEKSKIFVLSSNYEGMPNALMEAMALGVACISTDCSCGGPRELINHKENGLLTKVNDVDELYKNLKILVNNGDIRDKLGINARESMKNYSTDIIMKQWVDFISKIKR